MTYLLATTEKKARWYAVTDHGVGTRWTYDLLEVLDLNRVDTWADKETARLAAQAMGLSSWCCVGLSPEREVASAGRAV